MCDAQQVTRNLASFQTQINVTVLNLFVGGIVSPQSSGYWPCCCVNSSGRRPEIIIKSQFSNRLTSPQATLLFIFIHNYQAASPLCEKNNLIWSVSKDPSFYCGLTYDPQTIPRSYKTPPSNLWPSNHSCKTPPFPNLADCSKVVFLTILFCSTLLASVVCASVKSSPKFVVDQFSGCFGVAPLSLT